MNRKIKFRAWDRDFEEMLQVKAIIFDPKTLLSKKERMEPYILDEHNDIHFLSDIKLLQYTGIKDYEDKEIYEGDIIRLEGVDDREIGSTWEHIGKIVYKRGAFFVCYFDYYADGDEELICDAQVEFGTVIGNIYENKELLEED